MTFASLRKARQERHSFVQPAQSSRQTDGIPSTVPGPNEDSSVSANKADLENPQPSPSPETPNQATTSSTNLYKELPPVLEIRSSTQRGREIYVKSLGEGGLEKIPAGTSL
ncbi:hypothetical protein FRC02_002420 [Tulasnella sp. 418]|nr:hypothetical protein FRC02_002420 [Tulasnella sp. 418]